MNVWSMCFTAHLKQNMSVSLTTPLHLCCCSCSPPYVQISSIITKACSHFAPSIFSYQKKISLLRWQCAALNGAGPFLPVASCFPPSAFLVVQTSPSFFAIRIHPHPFRRLIQFSWLMQKWNKGIVFCSAAYHQGQPSIWCCGDSRGQARAKRGKREGSHESSFNPLVCLQQKPQGHPTKGGNQQHFSKWCTNVVI